MWCTNIISGNSGKGLLLDAVLYPGVKKKTGDIPLWQLCGALAYCLGGSCGTNGSYIIPRGKVITGELLLGEPCNRLAPLLEGRSDILKVHHAQIGVISCRVSVLFKRRVVITCRIMYLEFNVSFITVSLFFPPKMVTRQKSI